jgi:hopanoid biosynthesis associated protein HpnK
LQNIMFAELLAQFSYAAVVVGSFVEGEFVLLAAGGLARAGRLSPVLVALSGSVGSAAWNQVWFRIGRRTGQQLLVRHPSWRGRTQVLERWLSTYGRGVLVLGRFAPGMGGVLPATVGASGLAISRFVPLDLLGALVWSSAYTAVGFGALGLIERWRSESLPIKAISMLLLALAAVACFWLCKKPRARQAPLQPRLIVTADDFGLAPAVNEAVELAHRQGIVTTTSLMVNEAAAGDAIARARRNPRLQVGLHIVLCEGMASQSPRSIPLLVNRRGDLHSPLAAILLFAVGGLRASLRQQLESEIRSQFRAFAATGLQLDHVNVHNNLQLHPVVLPILLRVAREYGVKAFRVPYEPLIASWRAARSRPLFRLMAWLFMGTWARAVRWWVRGCGFLVNDYLFGVYDCGSMDEQLLSRFVASLPDGLSEVHCHPATHLCAELSKVAPNYQPSAELAALLSPRVREAIAVRGVRLLFGFAQALEAVSS